MVPLLPLGSCNCRKRRKLAARKRSLHSPSWLWMQCDQPWQPRPCTGSKKEWILLWRWWGLAMLGTVPDTRWGCWTHLSHCWNDHYSLTRRLLEALLRQTYDFNSKLNCQTWNWNKNVAFLSLYLLAEGQATVVMRVATVYGVPQTVSEEMSSEECLCDAEKNDLILRKYRLKDGGWKGLEQLLSV